MTLQTLYDAAMLRGPRSVPLLGRLGGGTIATISESQPFRVIGSNAVVYQLRQATGKVVALRCWLNDEIPPELIERYRALGHPSTLRRLHGVERSPVIGAISLHADGVVIEAEDLGSSTRPIVVLDWLMGPTVMAAVDRACRSQDTGYLAALAQTWRGAVSAAGRVGFVHGDLTADNAIVRPKEGIAFVDYDTAYWLDAPSVPRLDPAVSYRHPRGITSRPGHADEFAALLIYVSLRVLAVWPELRAEHGQAATMRGAGLLFQPRDLSHPDGSQLFGKLRVVNDSQVQGLVGILREACLAHPDEIPTFAESLTLAANVAAAPIAFPIHGQRSGRVSSLLSSTVTGDRRTDQPRPKPIDPDVEVLWPERQRNWRPERLSELAAAVEQRDLDRAEALWTELRDEPGAGALLPAIEALRHKRAGHHTVTAEEIRAKHLSNRKAQIKRRFANALDHNDRAVLADLALSGDIDEIDELTEASTRRIVGSLAIGHLERALESDDDLLIMEAYDARVLGDKGLLTSVQQNRVDLAFDRHAWLKDVRGAIRKRDLAAIDRLYAAMPDGAHQRLTDRERARIERLHVQESALQSLRSAIDDGRDADVITALNAVERSGAVIPQDLSWANVSDVIDRYSLMSSVRRAAEQHPRDIARLARLLPQLKEKFGGVFPDVGDGLDFARLDAEITQSAQLVRIREAIATNDDRKIVAAALPDVYGVMPMLERGEQARIERAVAAANRALRRSGHRSSSPSSSATVDTV
jgi:phosphotransferase family enzyme